jgi:hypothetical protein
MSGPRPRHVQVSEGIDLPTDLSARTVDFSRFSPAAVDFLAGRPAVAHSAWFPAESDHFSPPSLRFSSVAYPPSRPTQFTISSADYRLIPTGFRLATADFNPPGPASAPLSTGANRERRIHSVAELGRPNTIYMSSGPSGPIFTFLIQFEFYPIKRSRFENFSPPIFLEFHLVFHIIFSDFFWNFQIWIQKIGNF